MKQYKIFLLHTFILSFTELSFAVFGSLLFYLKTGSLIYALFFILIMKGVAVFIKSILITPFLRIVKRLGVINTIALSLVVWGVATVCLFFTQVTDTQTLILFFLAGVLYSIAHSAYWILANAFGFHFVGSSKIPGQYSSYWQLAGIFAGIVANLTGLFLNFDDNFAGLLLVMGGMILVSILPLRYLSPPEVQVVSFKECMKKVSRHCLLANINLEHAMITVAAPLIILFTYDSLSKSISIGVTVALVTIFLVYFVGKAKDRHQNKLVALGGAALILGIVAYGFVHSPVAFIVVGIMVGLSSAMIETARDAGAGRELTNNKSALQGTVAIEFARSLGGFIGVAILIITYFATGSIWQPILVIGVITTLPKVFYSIKNIQVSIKR